MSTCVWIKTRQYKVYLKFKAMQKILYITLGLIATLLLATSCEDDPTLTKLQAIGFDSEASISVTELVLAEENANDVALTFSWTEVAYPISTYPVEYSVEVTDVTDEGWAMPTVFTAGEDVTSVGLTGVQLNDLGVKFGYTAEEVGTFKARIRSYVDRAAYSNELVFALTPYFMPVEDPGITYPSLWVPGDFQNWTPVTAPKLASFIEGEEDTYLGFFNIEEGAGLGIKLTAQPSWEPTAYGNDGETNLDDFNAGNVAYIEGNLRVSNEAGYNFGLPQTGYFCMTANLADMTYTITPINTLGIIGDAAPNGWDGSTPMTYDAENQVWIIEATFNAGGFKIRANDNWDIQIALNDNDKPFMVDHYVLNYSDVHGLVSVPEAGNYRFTLDLSNPGNFSYDFVKL